MFGLKILTFILPYFHPLKYKYISWWFGTQANNGACHTQQYVVEAINNHE